MPTIKARVGGAWVDLTAGADEVWVGSAAPTDPATELWVYPDGYSVNDPNIARWNSAWGVVATASVASAQTGITTLTDFTGLTTTFTPVAGRRYKVTVSGLQLYANGTGIVDIKITDGSNNQIVGVNGSVLLGWVPFPDLSSLPVSPSGGVPYTVKCRLSMSASSINTNQGAGAPAFITVEDVGPVSQAVAPPVQPPSVWTTPTLLNAWQNLGAPWATAGYRLVGDMVQLRGALVHTAAIPATTSSTVFTLPVGYRPANNLIFSGNSAGLNWGDTPVRVDIWNTGEVVLWSSAAAQNIHVYSSISNVSFSVTA